MKSIEEFDKLKTKVLKYIIYKKRTEKEIRQKFCEIDSEELEEVINHLKEIGYINDERYVEKAINEFIATKNMSMQEIKMKLLQRGIGKEYIETYFENNYKKLQEYEISSCKNIIAKKNNTLNEVKLKDYLIKKGYNIEDL